MLAALAPHAQSHHACLNADQLASAAAFASTGGQLRKDTRAELPLWLAKSLTERGITRMDAPAVYGEW